MRCALALLAACPAALGDCTAMEKCPDPVPKDAICCVAGQKCPSGDECCLPAGGTSALCPTNSTPPGPAPPGPAGGKCGGECTKTDDCAGNSYCKFCLQMSGTAPNKKGVCGAQCGEPCSQDDDCFNPDGCQWCTEGVCSMTDRAATCLSPCVSDISCRYAFMNQTSDCRLCYKDRGFTGDCADSHNMATGHCHCAAGCGRRCSDDAECQAAGDTKCPACADFDGTPEGHRCNETDHGKAPQVIKKL